MRLSFFGNNEKVIQKAVDILASDGLIIYQQKQYMPWVAQVTMPRPFRSWRRSNMRKRQSLLLVWFVHPYPKCGGLVGITSNNYSSRHWEIYIEKNATLRLRFQNIF